MLPATQLSHLRSRQSMSIHLLIWSQLLLAWCFVVSCRIHLNCFDLENPFFLVIWTTVILTAACVPMVVSPRMWLRISIRQISWSCWSEQPNSTAKISHRFPKLVDPCWSSGKIKTTLSPSVTIHPSHPPENVASPWSSAHPQRRAPRDVREKWGRSIVRRDRIAAWQTSMKGWWGTQLGLFIGIAMAFQPTEVGI